MGYKVPTVEIDTDDLIEIITLFVRINSTGKSLTSAEKRHAKYFHSGFLKAAEVLAKKHQAFFLTLLTKAQISRMKDIELICELMASILEGRLLDKKKAIDKVIAGRAVNKRALDRCCQQFTQTLNLVCGMFPALVSDRSTRFAKVVDFYSLFMLVHDLKNEGKVLNNRSRNEQAQQLLIKLSNGVDLVRQQIRKAEGAKEDQQLFRDYLFTVQDSTDTQAMRKRRADLLRQILHGIFEEKDSRRTFSAEQRRLIWHSEQGKKCIDCSEPLTWNNFTLDHVVPHSRGGRTEITNAALMCGRCNPKKGAKKVAVKTRKR